MAHVLLLVVAGAGCTAEPPDGVFACASTSACPSPLECAAGLCRRHSAPGEGDAAGAISSEAGPDAALWSDSDADVSPPGVIDGGADASADTGWGSTDAASDLQDAAAGMNTDADTSGALVDANVSDARPPEAGASDATTNNPAADAAPSCTCAAMDTCCDGCRPRNESAACASDGLDCTEDVCRSGSCRHERKAGYCLIGAGCFVEGASNPNNKCQACNAVSAPSSWSNRARGAACDDGVHCNGADSCDGSGACAVHAGDPCRADACFKCNEATKSCPVSTTATYYDSTTNFLWDLSEEGVYDWQVAVDRCAGLTLCGHSDWRLPTITELRSVIRGCPANQAGGPCMVSTTCLQWSCTTACTECEFKTGPSSSGAYWPFDFSGNAGNTWSSSTFAEDSSKAWIVYFVTGGVHLNNKLSGGPASAGNARCVRTGRP